LLFMNLVDFIERSAHIIVIICRSQRRI